MPFALATGIGSTLACADHSYSECCFDSATISWPLIVVFSATDIATSIRKQASLRRRQCQHRERQHFRATNDIVDGAVFVGLMRHCQLARPVGHTMRHAGNPRN